MSQTKNEPNFYTHPLSGAPVLDGKVSHQFNYRAALAGAAAALSLLGIAYVAFHLDPSGAPAPREPKTLTHSNP